MSKSNAYLKRIKDLAAKNLKDGEQFLALKALRPEVSTLASGLQYEVLVSGSGAKPMAKSKVLCHYKGSLLDGTVFDSTYKMKRPAAFFFCTRTYKRLARSFTPDACGKCLAPLYPVSSRIWFRILDRYIRR